MAMVSEVHVLVCIHMCVYALYLSVHICQCVVLTVL